MTGTLFSDRALLHYWSLTPYAHSAGRAGMCSIELNGMWRIGHPGSGNFHCKWLLSHQGQPFIFLFSVETNIHNQDCFQSGRPLQPYTQEDSAYSTPVFALDCWFSHESQTHKVSLRLQRLVRTGSKLTKLCSYSMLMFELNYNYFSHDWCELWWCWTLVNYISVSWVQSFESHYSIELSWLVIFTWNSTFLDEKSDQSNEHCRISHNVVKHCQNHRVKQGSADQIWMKILLPHWIFLILKVYRNTFQHTI